jgi:hypothetical protein
VLGIFAMLVIPCFHCLHHAMSVIVLWQCITSAKSFGRTNINTSPPNAPCIARNITDTTISSEHRGLDREQDQDENKEFADAIDREDGINLLSDNEGDKDFLKEDLSKYHEDLTLFSDDYNASLEVSSGVLNAVHSNKFQVLDNFKQLILNETGPSPRSMSILL